MAGALVQGIDYYKSLISNINFMNSVGTATNTLLLLIVQHYSALCILSSSSAAVTVMSLATPRQSVAYLPPPKPITKESWNR